VPAAGLTPAFAAARARLGLVALLFAAQNADVCESDVLSLSWAVAPDNLDPLSVLNVGRDVSLVLWVTRRAGQPLLAGSSR